MRISDWSSDVCSSDLAARIFDHRRNKAQLLAGQALARNAVMPPRIELLRRPCWNDVHTRGPLTLLPFDTCFECSYFISHYDNPRMSGKPSTDQRWRKCGEVLALTNDRRGPEERRRARLPGSRESKAPAS